MCYECTERVTNQKHRCMACYMACQECQNNVYRVGHTMWHVRHTFLSVRGVLVSHTVGHEHGHATLGEESAFLREDDIPISHS